MTHSADENLKQEPHSVDRSGTGVDEVLTAIADPGNTDNDVRGGQALEARFIPIEDLKVTLCPGAPQPHQPAQADSGAGALTSP